MPRRRVVSPPSAAAARPAAASAAAEPIDPQLGQVLGRVADYFAVLSGPARLRILHALCDRERSVGEIVSITGLGQTNVSQQVALMHRTGLLGRRRAGTQIFYSVADPKVIEICRFVCVLVASDDVDEAAGGFESQPSADARHAPAGPTSRSKVRQP